MQTVDVVIVGGAAMGSSAAYFLAADAGFKGWVLEQGKPAKLKST
jgi:glycine/D-amino acid oxidase-like deaminating enzyme